MTADTTKPARTVFPDDFEIANVRRLIFSATKDPADDRLYILSPDYVEGAYLAHMHEFPSAQVKSAWSYYIDDPSGRWFAFANVDCFDPPLAVIRARSFEQAYEVFCDEFEKWVAVDEDSARDYPEDDRNYNGNGTHIATDGVQGFELYLTRVDVL